MNARTTCIAATLLFAPALAFAQDAAPPPADAGVQEPSSDVPATDEVAPDTGGGDAGTQATDDAAEPGGADTSAELPEDPQGPIEPQIIPPRLVEDVATVFPQAAFDADVQADVVVELDVDTNGATSNLVPLYVIYYTYDDDGYLVETQGAPEDDTWGFVEAALEAASQYAFEPALYISAESPDGVATPVRMQWSVGFVIEYESYERAADETDYVANTEASAETDDPPADDAVGPPVNFSGVLYERGTRSGLESFVVTVIPVGCEADTPEDARPASCDERIALTDADGRFEFAGLPAGPWRVVIEETGYEPYATQEDIELSSRLDVRYLIEPTGQDLYRSSTVATAPPREATRHEISVTEIARIPGTNNDALRVVQNLPGVARASFGGGDVIIRGSAPEDTLFFANTLPLPMMYHFGGLRAVIPTEMLSGVTFYPGAYGAEYGRANGGIVEAEIDTPMPEYLGGFFDTNLIDSSVLVQGPITDNISFQAHARRSYIDAILRPIAANTDLQLLTAPRYYDWQGKLQGTLEGGHRWSLFYYASDDLFDLVLDNEDLPPGFRAGFRLATRFQGIQADLVSPIAPNVENRFRAQYSVPEFGINVGSNLHFELVNRQTTVRDTLTFTLSEAVELRTGVDLIYNDFDISVRLPQQPAEGQSISVDDLEDAPEVEVSSTYVEPAFFVAFDLTPIEGLTLVPGARVDYFDLVDEMSFDLRLAARYQVTDPLLVKFGIGNFHQSPSPDETDDTFGNPELSLEQAIHYTGGVEYAFRDYLTGQFELFYKDMSDLVSSTSDTRENEAGEEVSAIYDNRGEGRVYGAEFLLRHELANNLFGWVAYTLSRSERMDSGDTAWRLFEYDQTHILTALVSYNLPRRWSVGARWRYVTGNPTTPVVQGVFNADNDQYDQVFGEAYSVRNDPFHQLDVRVDKTWLYDRWRLTGYLDVQNVYNRANQEGFQYSYDYTESAPVRGLPIFPSIGLRGEL